MDEVRASPSLPYIHAHPIPPPETQKQRQKPHHSPCRLRGAAHRHWLSPRAPLRVRRRGRYATLIFILPVLMPINLQGSAGRLTCTRNLDDWCLQGDHLSIIRLGATAVRFLSAYRCRVIYRVGPRASRFALLCSPHRPAQCHLHLSFPNPK